MTNNEPKGGVTPVSTRVMNLANFLSQAARRNPDEIALVHGDRRWRWSEMEARVDAMAYALVHEFGVRKGDRILVHSANCNQMFESMFAAFRAGAVWVPTNFRQLPEEVAYLAESSGARLVIFRPPSRLMPKHVGRRASRSDHASRSARHGSAKTMTRSLRAILEGRFRLLPSIAMIHAGISIRPVPPADPRLPC